MHFSTAICIRLSVFFLLTVALFIFVWIHIVDPQPLTASIVIIAIGAVLLTSALLIGIVILCADSIEKILGMARRKKRKWQEKWIEKNFGPTDSPSHKH